MRPARLHPIGPARSSRSWRSPPGRRRTLRRPQARAPLRSFTFEQQGPKLTATGEQGPGAFGVSVALSADGTTALVGAPDDGRREGAAWAFVRRPGGPARPPTVIGPAK